MKSFLNRVANRKDTGGLVNKVVKVGPYTVKVEACLGEGGQATIYRVRDSGTNTAYALKHMHLRGDLSAIEDCLTEIGVMKKLRDHPHVLTLRASALLGPKDQEQEAFLLLDLCTDNLVEYMKQRNNILSDASVLDIFHSVCKAVAIMHQQEPPLSHRDLKAENVLLHTKGSWVLCDFGSSTTWTGTYQSTNDVMMGEETIRKYTTPAYRAPEMYDLYSREVIGTKADMWALGVLLFFIAYGRLPFDGEAKLQILNGDFRIPPKPTLSPVFPNFRRKAARCSSREAGVEGELDKLVINARPAEGEHPPKEDSCDRVKDCVRPSIHQVRSPDIVDLIRGLLTVSPTQRFEIDKVLWLLERIAAASSISDTVASHDAENMQSSPSRGDRVPGSTAAATGFDAFQDNWSDAPPGAGSNFAAFEEVPTAAPAGGGADFASFEYPTQGVSSGGTANLVALQDPAPMGAHGRPPGFDPFPDPQPNAAATSSTYFRKFHSPSPAASPLRNSSGSGGGPVSGPTGSGRPFVPDFDLLGPNDGGKPEPATALFSPSFPDPGVVGGGSGGFDPFDLAGGAQGTRGPSPGGFATAKFPAQGSMSSVQFWSGGSDTPVIPGSPDRSRVGAFADGAPDSPVRVPLHVARDGNSSDTPPTEAAHVGFSGTGQQQAPLPPSRLWPPGGGGVYSSPQRQPALLDTVARASPDASFPELLETGSADPPSEVASLRRQVAAQDGHISALQQTLSQKDTIIQQLQAELELHRTQVRRLESQMTGMGLEAAAGDPFPAAPSAWDPFQAPSTIAAVGARSSKHTSTQPSQQGDPFLEISGSEISSAYDEEEDAHAPLTQGRDGFKVRHRRTTSEPTPVDSWGLSAEWNPK